MERSAKAEKSSMRFSAEDLRKALHDPEKLLVPEHLASKSGEEHLAQFWNNWPSWRNNSIDGR